MLNLDPEIIHKEVRDVIFNICEILYKKGIKTVRVGAMMRLLGISEEVAQEYDKDIYHLDERFEKLLSLRHLFSTDIPPDAKIH